MKVPTYERQVMPTAQVNPNAISGQQVSQAVQQLGETAQNLGQQVQQRRLEIQQQKDTQFVLDKQVEMSKKINEVLYSTEAGKDGNPTGVLQRKLKNADGSLINFDQKMEAIHQEFLGMMNGENQQRAFEQLYRNAYEASEGVVVRHEAEQFQADQENTYKTKFSTTLNDVRNNPGSALIKQSEQKAIAEIYGKQQGLDSQSIENNQRTETDQIVANAIEPLLAADNHVQAQEILTKLKGDMSAKGVQAVEEAIKKVEQNDIFDKTSDELVAKYGDNLEAGDSAIKIKQLSADDEKQLLSIYHAKYTLKQQEDRAAINDKVSKFYTNIEKAGSGAAAYKLINSLPQKTQDEFQVKQNLRAIVPQLYPDYDPDGSKRKPVQTVPEKYWQLRDDIKTGKVATLPEMLAKYGSTVSLDHLTSFANLLEKGQTMNSLISDCDTQIEKNKIKTPEEQAKFFDYVNKNINYFKSEKGRGPNQEEQNKIIKDSMTTVIIEKTQKRDLGLIGGINQMLGGTGIVDKITTGKKYTSDLPLDFEMDKNIGYNTITKNGKTFALVKWNKETRTGVVQEVITKNGKRQLSTKKQTFAY